MARTFDVFTNAAEVEREFGRMGREQVPFATAKALTQLAFDGQRAGKTELERALELRNRYSATGIQVDPANKAAWPNIEAKVGVEQGRSYLIDHITGGKRDGGTHGRAILEADDMRSASGKVAKGKRPAALIAKAKYSKRKADLAAAFGGRKRKASKPLPFLFFSRRWGNEVLAVRTGEDRYPLKILYAFRKGVSIKREFELDLAVQGAVLGNYKAAFDKALRRAIATGKSKAERMGSQSRGQEIDTGR